VLPFCLHLQGDLDGGFILFRTRQTDHTRHLDAVGTNRTIAVVAPIFRFK
jgi:hypothetical protein